MTITTSITERPLDLDAAIRSVTDPRCGGIASFVGSVRRAPAVEAHAHKEVIGLEYEAHPSLAEVKLTEIAEAAAAKWGLIHVTLLHRTGTCALGEPTVVVACSAAHRAEALDACRWMIDDLKTTVPIWKREIYSDGTAWVSDNRF